MKIMVDIGHPSYVHLFKNFIWEMEKRNHQIIVTARDKDVAIKLLEHYSIKHSVIGSIGKGFIRLLWEWAGRDIEIYRIARKFKPDLFTGQNNPCMAHSALLIGGRYINYTDTEHAKLENILTHPFSDIICTPYSYEKDLGKKQIRYNGYKELAYLHPNYFKPDPSILDDIGLHKDEKYVVLRFVAWRASHDVGKKSLSTTQKRELVNTLKAHARLLITSEEELPEEFEEYRITVPPERMHDLLAYATLYIGEGASMASEAAVLGTPAVYINPLKLGYLNEQEKKYGLVYNFHQVDDKHKSYLKKAIELLKRDNLREEWKSKRERLLKDTIDVTKFMIEQAERIYSTKAPTI